MAKYVGPGGSVRREDGDPGGRLYPADEVEGDEKGGAAASKSAARECDCHPVWQGFVSTLLIHGALLDKPAVARGRKLDLDEQAELKRAMRRARAKLPRNY